MATEDMLKGVAEAIVVISAGAISIETTVHQYTHKQGINFCNKKGGLTLKTSSC